MTTAYLRTKLKGNSDAKTSIRNGKVFDTAWPDPDILNTSATKAMLQAEYGTREKRAGNLLINLSTAYGLVLGQCKDYLRLRLEGQEKWETMLNEQDLIGLLKIVKSLLHKYDEDTEYHHIAYQRLLRRFMLFRKGDYINSEYKQQFKEQIEVLEAYNGGSYSGTARELWR